MSKEFFALDAVVAADFLAGNGWQLLLRFIPNVRRMYCFFHQAVVLHDKNPHQIVFYLRSGSTVTVRFHNPREKPRGFEVKPAGLFVALRVT